MRSLVSIVLLLSAVTPFTLAEYAVSNPGTGVTWKSGDNQKVTWTVITASDQKCDVKLVRGPASDLKPVATLCSGVDPSVGSCSCVVPANLQSDRNYAITVGDDNNPAHKGYSSFFNVQSSGELPPQSGCPNFGGQICPDTLPCCSSSGYCGATDEYCGTGCMAQYSFGGKCTKPGSAPVSTPPTKKPSTKKPSTKKTSTKKKTSAKKKPSTKKPSTKKPSTKKPSTKKTTTKKTTTKKSSTKKGGK